MPVRVECDYGYAFGVAAKHAGQRIRCPECRGVALVPGHSKNALRASRAAAEVMEADREARNTKTTEFVALGLLASVVLIIAASAFLSDEDKPAPLPMGQVIEVPPHSISGDASSKPAEAAAAKLTAEKAIPKPQLAEKEPDSKLPAEKPLPPTEPVFTDALAAVECVRALMVGLSAEDESANATCLFQIKKITPNHLPTSVRTYGRSRTDA